jgi:hypothetical protein
MSTLTPERLNVLSRIKRYGLDTWEPGALVIARRTDVTFVTRNAPIIADLIRSGHLARDHAGSISAGLAGDHELHQNPSDVNESRARIAGRIFQVVTEHWTSESEATRVRDLVLSGLASVAHTDPARLDRIRQAARDGIDDERLEAIVASAMDSVSERGSDGAAHRVGVRVFEN